MIHALDALCKRCNDTGLMRCEGARLHFVGGGGGRWRSSWTFVTECSPEHMAGTIAVNWVCGRN